jgi:serine/threonine protein phosphatase PrpC
MLSRLWAARVVVTTGSPMPIMSYLRNFLSGHKGDLVRNESTSPVAGSPVTEWSSILVQSPGHEDGEPKDQDRIRWFPDSKVACVCDGTTSSPYSAEAAQLVADQAAYLFQSPENMTPFEVCEKLRDKLQNLRREAALRPIRTREGLSDAVREMILAEAEKKRQKSHQTTVAAASMKLEHDGLHIHLFKCGDSEMLVFDTSGELLYPTALLSNADLQRKLLGIGESTDTELPKVRFRRRSNVTDVLPDSPNESISWHPDLHFAVYGSILLASDGMLDAFEGPTELYQWLMKHEQILASGEDREVILTELHQQLAGHRGDDDISFVWIQPPPMPEIDVAR